MKYKAKKIESGKYEYRGCKIKRYRVENGPYKAFTIWNVTKYPFGKGDTINNGRTLKEAKEIIDYWFSETDENDIEVTFYEIK